MDRENMVDFGFEEYSKTGGQLSQEDFIEAKEFLSKIDNGQEIEACDFWLVKTMVGRYNLDVTDKQIGLYILMRNGNIGGLCDQKIICETLLLTRDIVNRETFINKNPVIFNNI